MKLALLSISILLSVQSVFASHDVICRELLLERSSRLEVIRENLLSDIKNPQTLLKSIVARSNDLVFKEFLGQGAQGEVYLVERDGKSYALKLLRPRFGITYTDSIVIQKYLGDLDMAPKVLGVLDQFEIQYFLKRYENSIDYLQRNGVFTYGVLMELTSSKFLKEGAYSYFKKTQVTPAQKINLLNQAKNYLYILNELNIHAGDIDATVDPVSGHLLLVDMGFYRLQKHTNAQIKGFGHPSDSAIENDLIMYINFGTHTLKARWRAFQSFFSLHSSN